MIQGLKGVVAAIVRAHYIVASCARARRGLALGQHDALTAVITTRMGPHGGAIVPSWWRLARVQERARAGWASTSAPNSRMDSDCEPEVQAVEWLVLWNAARRSGHTRVANMRSRSLRYKLLRRNEDRTSHETQTSRAGDGVRRTTDKAEGSVCRRKVRSGWPCHAIHAFHKTTWNEKNRPKQGYMHADYNEKGKFGKPNAKRRRVTDGLSVALALAREPAQIAWWWGEGVTRMGPLPPQQLALALGGV